LVLKNNLLGRQMTVNLGNKEERLTSDSMIVTETDEKGDILFASKDFCKIAGYSSEELIGKPHNIIRHPFMPKAAFKDLWDTVKAGKIWNGVVVNTTKTGGYYWVKATVYPSQTFDGRTKYVSVRVMPSKADIENAMALYPTLK
jgi:aerotaxis receptor